MGAIGYTSGDPRKVDRSGYTKGDVLAADATGDLTAVPVGTDTEVLTADSTDPEGVDWQPGGGGSGTGTPSNTTVSETSYGQPATAGAAAAYSRGDHTHGTPSLTGTAPVTTLGIGQAAAVGVATTPARADHVHPVAGSGIPSTSAVGDSAAQGAATTFARSDHTHGREGFAAPADSLVGDTQSAGVAATVARSDHRHAREPFGAVTAQTSFGEPSSDGSSTSVARADHTHGTPAAPTVPAAATTVVTETTFGQASATGVATTYARGDHTHGTPAAPTPASIGAVPTSRSVNTTAPLAGGGDLSTDRTISLNTDGITNTLLANMPANTIKGNNTGGSADPADLTVSQVLAMLNVARITETWSRDGDATVTTGGLRWYNRTGKTLTIHGAWASAGTPPTDAALVVDVNKNGTTIFTTQASRPTVTAGSNGGTLAIPDVTTLADGDYLTVDIDQIGATIAGADVTVGVVVS